MSAAESFRTVAAPVEHEPDKTKGSRHIGHVFPVQDQDAIDAALASVRARLPDATHHAWAWRLGPVPGGDVHAGNFRFSDDGEPSGTAGRPILQQIDGRGLTDVLVVVTRYFGGTKLGGGGLVRAYGGAAAAALDRAEVVVVVPHATLRVHHAYEDSGAVAGVLSAFDVVPTRSDYGEAVDLELRIELERADQLVSALREATAARARIEVESTA